MSDNEEKEEESKAKQEAAENAALDAVGNIAGPEAKAVTETAKVVKKKWPYILGLNVLLFAIIFGPLIAILFMACSGGSSIYSLMGGGNFSSDGSSNGTNNGNGGTVNEDCIGKINPAAKKYVAKVNEAAQKFGTDPALMLAQLDAESGFRPDAVSSAGAQGIAQFMPGTWSSMSNRFNIDGNGNGTENPFEAEDGIYAQGAYNLYISSYLAKYNLNTMENVLAAYNAGEGAVVEYHGVPPFSQTQKYVAKIMASYKKYKKCLEQLNNNTNVSTGSRIKKLVEYAKTHDWGQDGDGTGCFRACDKLYTDALGNPAVNSDLNTKQVTGVPSQSDLDELRKQLNEDHVVYWYIRGEYSGQHWIIVTDIDENNNITYLDPIGKGSIQKKAYNAYVEKKEWYYFSRTPLAPNSYLRGIYKY